MEYYTNEIKDILDDIVAEGYETREEVLKRWAEGDTQDDFGNMTGSRKCSTCEAEQDLKRAGFPWDQDINSELESLGYNIGDLLERGAEVIDVILCEIAAMNYANANI